MTTLTEFLLARLDDDTTAIRLAKCDTCLSYQHAPDDPETGRLLADVAAKRSIIELHRGFRDEHPGTTALHYLAAVYADHSDFDEAWRP